MSFLNSMMLFGGAAVAIANVIGRAVGVNV